MAINVTNRIRQLEAAERRALEDFQRKQKAERAKKVAKLLDPVRRERQKAAERLQQIDAMMAKLMGGKPPAVKAQAAAKTTAKKAPKQRIRRSEEERRAMAGKVLDFIKAKGPQSSGQLKHITQNVPVADLRKLEPKIKMSGDKATARYYAK